MIPIQEDSRIRISIDLKKNRIRIHKSTLHLLGDPPYIQLLINPSSFEVALKSVNMSSVNDQTHKVSKRTLHSDNCVEIYSKYFILKLTELIPQLVSGNCYHMSGVFVQSENMAVFSFKSLTPFSEESL